jgi:hypothetical protein
MIVVVMAVPVIMVVPVVVIVVVVIVVVMVVRNGTLLPRGNCTCHTGFFLLLFLFVKKRISVYVVHASTFLSNQFS